MGLFKKVFGDNRSTDDQVKSDSSAKNAEVSDNQTSSTPDNKFSDEKLAADLAKLNQFEHKIVKSKKDISNKPKQKDKLDPAYLADQHLKLDNPFKGK